MHSSHEAFEKKLDSEFKQLNESVNKLNNQDTRISLDVEELRKNQVITERMSERLAINVTNVESSVRELRKTNISSRVASLERGYTRMNNVMRTLQAIDTAQNASRQRLHSLQKRLRASLTAVNATLNDKVSSQFSFFINFYVTNSGLGSQQPLWAFVSSSERKSIVSSWNKKNHQLNVLFSKNEDCQLFFFFFFFNFYRNYDYDKKANFRANQRIIRCVNYR